MTEFNKALVVCGDEAIRVAPEVLIVGMLGSLVTGSASEKFPQQQLDLVQQVRQDVYSGVGLVAQEMKVSLEITSHVGCGWSGLQLIEPATLPGLTLEMSQRLNVDYAGHIVPAEQPTQLRYGQQRETVACIMRPELDHHHVADAVILTVGGFIAQGEKDGIVRDNGWRGAFVLAADHLSRVSEDMLASTLGALEAQLNVADNIMGVTLPPYIFDAGRLTPEAAAINTSLVEALL